MDIVNLSGRAYANKQDFAPPPKGFAQLPSLMNAPGVGDVRLDPVLDGSVRVLTPDRSQLRGSIVAYIYDGIAWRKLDLSAIASTTTFESAAQLHAMQVNVARHIALLAGCSCTLAEFELPEAERIKGGSTTTVKYVVPVSVRVRKMLANPGAAGRSGTLR